MNFIIYLSLNTRLRNEVINLSLHRRIYRGNKERIIFPVEDGIIVKSAFERWSSCVITIEQLNRNRNSTATELSSTSLISNGGFH